MILHWNLKYATEYAKDREMLGEFLKICTVEERSDKKRWCTFDIQQQFHSDCSKTTNYGYNSGNPCMLFIFNNVSKFLIKQYE